MRKFMLATGCAMALACALAVAPPSGAAEANRPVSAPTLTMLGRPIQDTPSSCEPYTIRSASFFKADGSPSTSADLTAGFVLMERTPAGLDVSLAVPPEGFTPATATDSTLSLFGIPDRPKSNEALADWLTVWGRTLHLPSIALPLGCSLPVASDLSVNSTEPAAGDPSSVASSTNWSGRLAGGTYFTSVAGTVTQPGYTLYNCGDASKTAHSTWVGLGGWNSGSLVQNGIDTYTGRTVPYAFWEALPDFPTEQYGGVSGLKGEQLHFTTTWNGAPRNTATFSWLNVATGSSTSITAGSARDFDPRHAEWIDERTSGCNAVDGPFCLFQRSDNQVNWGGERVNGSNPASSTGSVSIEMRRQNGTQLGYSTNVNSTASIAYWTRCS